MTELTFPIKRLRRLRQNPWIRNLVQETQLTPHDFVLPIFLREEEVQGIIPSMPGVKRYTLDELSPLIKEIESSGIQAVALFPCIHSSKKNAEGSEAFNENNLICQAIQKIKSITSSVGVITDVALDPYTDHCHDGILVKKKDGNWALDNDETIKALGKQALTLAKAGADIVAPSDMMDGRIYHIRHVLDDRGFKDIMILSYAAKYASAFYGPFREAVGVNCLKGLDDKTTYQLNPSNTREALRKIAQDIQEGADAIMVKPGMPYLDLITKVSEESHLPVFAYQVSGEYSMIKAASEQGMLDEKKAFLESMTAFKRAGASAILTYAALNICKWLRSV